MTARQPLAPPYNAAQLQGRIARQWDEDIVAQLADYVRIPARSPHFDPRWRENGHIEAAVRQARDWALRQPIAGLELEVVRLEGRTPVILFDVPATAGSSDQTVLLYGHLDKQPEMTGWRPGLGPWTPVIEEGRLYGRGAADDGYAIFAALSAILALDVQGVPRAALRGPDRDLRGERQLRPARVHRAPRAAHRQRGTGDRARLRRRQLRAALGRRPRCAAS